MRPMNQGTVLLIDIGNTRIKWTRWRAGRLAPQQARQFAGWTEGDFARELFRGGHDAGIERVVASSVAGSRVERTLARAARRFLDVRVEFATTVRHKAGLTTRYTEPWRLGVDRFLAALGAHQLAGGRPVCVVSAGTAVTIDLIDARGVHRGGAILPGPELMIRSLLENTDGIERRARGARSAGHSIRGAGRAEHRGGDLFARSTRAAIEQGARQAIGALIDRAVARARVLAGRAPLVVLTGGAATQLRGSFGARAVLAPDLVLRGLALYAGLNLSAPARIRSGSQGPRN